MGTTAKPPEIAARGIEKAKEIGADFVIVDTAGRLQVDADVSVQRRVTVPG